MECTIFTLNVFDNGYFTDGLPTNKFCKECIIEWKLQYPKFEVFDYNHPYVIQAKQEMKKNIDYLISIKANPMFIADIIRIHILANHKNFLYVDTDTYPIRNIYDICNNYSFVDYNITCENFPICFDMLYSGNDNIFYKTILDYYKSHIEPLCDCAIIDTLAKEKNISVSNFLQLNHCTPVTEWFYVLHFPDKYLLDLSNYLYKQSDLHNAYIKHLGYDGTIKILNEETKRLNPSTKFVFV